MAQLFPIGRLSFCIVVGFILILLTAHLEISRTIFRFLKQAAWLCIDIHY